MKLKSFLARVIPTSGRRFDTPSYDLLYKPRLYLQAALCALRVIRKVPDLTDHFVAKAKNLLADRNHGVLLSSITLMYEMCQTDENVLNEFRSVSRGIVH
jgi:hypothetical protein